MPRQKTPRGKKNALILAGKINTKNTFDGFFSMVIEGVQRRGKSSYARKSLASANGVWELEPQPLCVEPDYESVNPWVIFKPEDVLDKVLDVEAKQKAMLRDDAGY
jgi:hypothetical protein